jgi:CDP-diacylglycerol---glycerol-3-phosphate 3-phosphatidyltransferase
MRNISNGLSLLRGPLALIFLIENATLRLAALIVAMLSDVLDGYLARKLSSVTRLGTILDPAMDKFFVFFALGICLIEGKLEVWQACSMISRDFFLCVFGLYLGVSGHWRTYQCKAARWGKATTALQFFILIALTLHFSISWYTYFLFILFGALAFIELCQREVARLSAGST